MRREVYLRADRRPDLGASLRGDRETTNGPFRIQLLRTLTIINPRKINRLTG